MSGVRTGAGSGTESGLAEEGIGDEVRGGVTVLI